MNQVLLSSKNMNWCTPQDFLDKLNTEFHFALDAAATERSAKCENYFTPETDGLAQSWCCRGAVFCNPPYGREIRKWVQKAYTEAQNGQTIVLLIPARTDTAFFHDYIYGKAEVRFVRGRLTFTDEDGNPQRDKNGRTTPDGGITYWCGEADVVGDYLGDYTSDQISRGGSIKLRDVEDENEEWVLDLDKFLAGYRKIHREGLLEW